MIHAAAASYSVHQMIYYQFYACFVLLTFFGGISILTIALMSLYGVSGVEVVFSICLACFYGLVRLIFPPWPRSRTTTTFSSRIHADDSRRQRQALYDHDRYEERKKNLLIDSFSMKELLNNNAVSDKYRTEENKQCCSICLYDLEPDDIASQGKVCKHLFHRDCLSMWLDKSLSCPYCRKDFDALDDDVNSKPREGPKFEFLWGVFDGIFESIYV